VRDIKKGFTFEILNKYIYGLTQRKVVQSGDGRHKYEFLGKTNNPFSFDTSRAV
jgi:hypothetical protein